MLCFFNHVAFIKSIQTFTTVLPVIEIYNKSSPNTHNYPNTLLFEIQKKVFKYKNFQKIQNLLVGRTRIIFRNWYIPTCCNLGRYLIVEILFVSQKRKYLFNIYVSFKNHGTVIRTEITSGPSLAIYCGQ